MKKMVIPIILLVIIILASFININISLDSNDEKEKNISDETILKFLKEENIINSQDIYKTTYSEIGLYGIEDKEYVYEKNNNSYYVVDIDDYTYASAGEYQGYSYDANEIFYVIKIQDCNYNESVESIDETISERYGQIEYYIISNKNNNLKLTNL